MTATSLAAITDGTSNTACYSERIKGIGNGSALSFKQHRDGLSPSSSWYKLPQPVDAAIGPALFYAACKAVNTRRGVLGRFGAPGGFWWQTLNGNVCYTHVMPPNGTSCAFPYAHLNVPGGTATRWLDNHHPMGALTASSRHPGGVNVLLLDGSVRFVKATVSVPTWWALGTVASGEVIPDGGF